MKNEREMFETYFKTVWKGIDLIQTIGEDFAFKLLDDKYVEDIVEEHWRTWQASASREGYKLVKECEIEKTDQEIDQLIDERDTAQEQAEELKDKLQALYGFDFGDHSNANCPFQNAIDYDDSDYKLVPVETLEECLSWACCASSESWNDKQRDEIDKHYKVIEKAMIGVSE